MGIDLTFDPSYFTDVFYKTWEANTRWVINYGGTASSKSYSQAQKEVIKCLESRRRTLVVRKVGTTLKDSVIPLVQKIVQSIEDNSGYHMRTDWTLNKQENNLVNLRNGSRIMFRGLDDPEKIKSIEGVSRIWLEEATEFDKADILELNRRVRAVPNIQLTLTFNPIVITHWIKEHFFSDSFDNITYIHSTYQDNRWLTAEDIKEIERLKEFPGLYNQYRVYCLGEWGSISTGHEYYYAFNYEQHVTDVAYDPSLPVFISFDQNVVPYITLLCFQVKREDDIYHVRQFDEFCLKNPQNTTEAVCGAFAAKYGNTLTGLYYFGDASGKHRDTRGIENDYDIVDRVLSRWLNPNSRRIPSANPHLSKRRDFMNRMLAGYYPIRLHIDRSCKNTITDLESVKEDVDRGKLKERVRDKLTGISYEAVGHASDSLDYLCCENFKSYYYG